MDKELELKLWGELSRDRDAPARFTLIDHYSYLARVKAAHYYRRRLSDDIEYDDYLQYAMVGLIEAVQRYQPQQGAVFATYANYRIKGALLNGLEKSTEQREQSAFLRRHQKTRIASIAQQLEPGEKQPFDRVIEVTVELALSFLLEESGMLLAKDETGETLYQGEISKSLSQRLDSLIDKLPDREAFIVRSHYYYGMAFDELARCLDITKGRVSQLHKRALQRIREAYEQIEGVDNYY